MADAKVIPFDDDRDRSRAPGSPAGRGPGDASGASSGAGRSQGPRTGGQAGPGEEPGPGGVRGARRGGTGRRSRLTAVSGRRADPAEDAGEPSGQHRPDAAAAGAGPEGSAAGGSATRRGAAGPAAAEEPAGLLERVLGTEWEARAAEGLAFLRRRLTGEYEVDDFGFDEELTDQVLMTLLRPVFEKYFRVEVRGVENIPADGAALVVANHSGTLPLDGLMLQVAVHDEHPADRHLRLLGADLVFVLPLVNELARKAGHTLACAEDAQTLLERGEVVGVMPEGFKGLGKPFADRYKLQRFGRGGFVSTALRAGAPIVPCSIVGAEEIYPMVGNSRTLARLFGFPYFPLTPTFPWLGPLGAVPLPTKWTIQFGEPLPTDGYPPEAAEDPMLMFNLTDQVRETIQHTLYKLLVRRRSVFF
ncbi:lysophospholipid acyltransferase family protein [Streptomyces qinglanensis]|uniref:1-acyl-sn-glycerol-3-phosphate acyltransferase n=1 Tax=Streptomyces qinglanensis TaxID=943816 RepID=A0A1H9WX90_9ACTN|nr:lysophospholipid acyltransferase family protein [Streptomyces qinglanensis]SES38552.1 1-acyl-sn-glycerol-3-phosphate acyltransferase [Streptomyces qinglanensis]